MKKTLTIVALALLTGLLFIKEARFKRPSEPVREGCLSCHGKMKDPDPSHPVSAFGCHTCHLGNRYSLDRERAHFTMVRNPGDLRVADRTCGKTGCHPGIVTSVKNSLMATNAGILKTIQAEWLESGDGPSASPVAAGIGVSDLYRDSPPENLAIDHYRKMCGGCHLWKRRGDRRGEVGTRGGGCSDCHVIDDNREKDSEREADLHPAITTRIPSSNCTKCHNRSARIGLSYFGRFESAGYGTPYEGVDLSHRRLSGNRFFLNLHADVHFSRAGMECIDCHTATGLMGDGNRYERMRSQTEITCKACHLPQFSPIQNPLSPAARSAPLNRRVPWEQGTSVAVTKGGTPIYNLQKKGDSVIFFRKMDGRAFEMNDSGRDRACLRLKGHERLSCQACHSLWIPQCYGCHLTYNPSEKQRDWITGRLSRGRWREARSYLRFSRPALGVRDDGKVFPISPCQEFVWVFDQSGGYKKDKSFRTMNISAFDPHTTTSRSRGCIECHADPKVIGLGEGILHRKEGGWVFRPTYDSTGSGLGLAFPLDGFVNLEGKALQSGLNKGVRPFNRDEIARILSVSPCLGCHDRYDDTIYRDFRGSVRRFQGGDLPCLK
ncbi:MAG: hypothetical protein JRJ09_10045 [Deltaproteobacteria bacterium]|nr:hypothetical protein [Deltaproteobacteria bacterium]